MSIGGHTRPGQGETQVWLTPPDLIRALGPFDLDPCPAPDPKPWETADAYCVDGLTERWHGFVFCNPPYSSGMGPWIDRMVEHRNGIILIFARTETPYGQKALGEADLALFLCGRLYFHHPNGDRAKGNAGAPSMLLAYGDEASARLRRNADKGLLMRRETAWHE